MEYNLSCRWDVDKIESRVDKLNKEEFKYLNDFLEEKIEFIKKIFQNHTPRKIHKMFFDNPKIVKILKKSRLIAQYGDEFYTTFRIFNINDFFVTTDFPSVQTQKGEERVFPWVDEGIQLLSYIEQLDIKQPPKRILNMCCGAGTVALGLAKKWPNSEITAVDINNRAILCADFNKKLNNITNITFKIGNLFEGLENTKYDLIVVDPPFALQPPSTEEYIHSAGKKYGEAVIEPLIRDVSDYLKKDGRFITLCYSLGNKTTPLRIQSLIEEHFQPNDIPIEKQCILLEERKVWRFHGEKRINQNPMPIRYMAIRCGDEDYKIYEQVDGIEKYINWIEKDLVNHEPSYTHLHYLIVDHISK